jgi:integrase
MSFPRKLIARPLSEERIALALEHIQATSPAPAREELVLWLAVYLQLRAHEIALLELSPLLDAPEGVIRIDKRVAKYTEPRAVPMPQRVREALIRFKAAYPDAGRVGDALAGWGTAEVRQWLTSTYALIGHIPEGVSKARLSASAALSGHQTPALMPLSTSRRRTANTQRASFRQSDLVRAVSAAKRAGLPVTATEIGTDGCIKLMHGQESTTSANAYEQWKERRDARS